MALGENLADHHILQYSPGIGMAGLKCSESASLGWNPS